MNNAENKLNNLITYIKNLGSLAVCYSAGVDSTFLLWAVQRALSESKSLNSDVPTNLSYSKSPNSDVPTYLSESKSLNSDVSTNPSESKSPNSDVPNNPSYRFAAFMVKTPFQPQADFNEARDFCREYNIPLHIIELDILSRQDITKNPENRCYLCKKTIMSAIMEAAAGQGLQYVAEGSNTDDTGDYRPGMKAIKELNIKSPLLELGFSKKDIRYYSEQNHLPTWNKPSFACLASRFPYGRTITKQELEMVERAESFLKTLGFSNYRARISGSLAGNLQEVTSGSSSENTYGSPPEITSGSPAGNLQEVRLELPREELLRALQSPVREDIIREMKTIGFNIITLDMEGFRSGSLNQGLKNSHSPTPLPEDNK